MKILLKKERKRIKRIQNKLKSTIIYNKSLAKRLCKMDYYKTQAKYQKNYALIEKEKAKLSTPEWTYITEILEKYKEMIESEDWKSPVGKTLLGIYNKNKNAVLTNSKTTNTNLLNVVSRPEILLLAYSSIKGNKGALTKGAYLSKEKLDSLTEEQKQLYYNSLTFPDKFNLKDILLTSFLLKKGLYPWGSSSRIYVPKPGVKDKMRPITIPPFLDRVIQKAICMILEAIYEPEFELLNRSFGFRPNKGTHDAITAVTSQYSSGKRMAVEGDIEAAYDTVNKDRLIKILGQKIQDKKFLQLIRERLDYDYVQKDEKNKETRYRPTAGIPQGGIDSPYLFNIYMNELDKYVHTEIKDYLALLNSRVIRRSGNKLYSKNIALQEKNERAQRKIKKKLALTKDPNLITSYKESLYTLIKEKRILKHKKNMLNTRSPHNKTLGFLYVRYADDWILLTNGNRELAEKIKKMISDFLFENLELKLSESKTIITDITKSPAKFLGFELRHCFRGQLYKKPILEKFKKPKYITHNLQRKGGTKIWASPDKQRLINRLHMKGFCNKAGFPRELPWLACVEPHVIIERYNACILGLANYYTGYIRDKSSIQRWIYILRFSCLKTLAQKYRLSIGGIFKKFGVYGNNKSLSTVQAKVRLKINEDIMEKSWKLLTYKDLMKQIPRKKQPKILLNNFWEIEHNRTIGEYPSKSGKIPTVTNDNYIEQVSWVSLRTQASLAMPCATCGSTENVHQHHIRRIRKNTYALLPDSMPWKKLLAIRNRKQIPLCKECHIHVVHKGKYDGLPLIQLIPQRMQRVIDNRMVQVENYVKKGMVYHAKSLEEKGWKFVGKSKEKEL